MTCIKCIKYVIIYREENKPFQKICISGEQSLEEDLKFALLYLKEHPVIKCCEYLEIQQNRKILLHIPSLFDSFGCKGRLMRLLVNLSR